MPHYGGCKPAAQGGEGTREAPSGRDTHLRPAGSARGGGQCARGAVAHLLGRTWTCSCLPPRATHCAASIPSMCPSVVSKHSATRPCTAEPPADPQSSSTVTVTTHSHTLLCPSVHSWHHRAGPPAIDRHHQRCAPHALVTAKLASKAQGQVTAAARRSPILSIGHFPG